MIVSMAETAQATAAVPEEAEDFGGATSAVTE
jgi:hypothetical protein